jgi:transposase
LYSCPKVIKTLSQSPELNVIENLWAQLETEISNHPVYNKGLKALRDEWERTSPEYTQEQNRLNPFKVI